MAQRHRDDDHPSARSTVVRTNDTRAAWRPDDRRDDSPSPISVEHVGYFTKRNRDGGKSRRRSHVLVRPSERRSLDFGHGENFVVPRLLV